MQGPRKPLDVQHGHTGLRGLVRFPLHLLYEVRVSGSRRLRLGWLLLVALPITWFVAHRWRREPSPRGASAQLASSPDSLAEIEDGLHRSPLTLDPTVPAKPPARLAADVLQEYWGDRWAEVELALREKGIDLHVPYELVPWETAVLHMEPLVALTSTERTQQFNNVFQWPVGSTPEELGLWLQLEFAVGDPSVEASTIEIQDVLAVEAAVQPFNDELAGIAADYVETVDQLLQMHWNSGDFQKAPFHSMSLPMEYGFFAKACAAESWTMVMTLKREDCPDVVKMEMRSATLREKRESTVRNLLHSRGYR